MRAESDMEQEVDHIVRPVPWCRQEPEGIEQDVQENAFCMNDATLYCFDFKCWPKPRNSSFHSDTETVRLSVRTRMYLVGMAYVRRLVFLALDSLVDLDQAWFMSPTC